jgi:phosphoribosylaminoimidazolecarboxamide formyltransferase/IMP cyclohydrolase
MSSFGDLIAVSDVVDVETAGLISKEVSDGIIAPGYAPEALVILRKKKAGKYVVLQVDPLYEPEESETRQVFGVQFRQSRHSRTVSMADLDNIVTERKDLSAQAVLDLKIAWITLKFTQSNSVCFVRGGQTIGVGAGQQSRVHCVRLAGTKADLWYLRQHPVVGGLKFAQGIKRPDRDNAIDQFLQPDVTEAEKANWKRVFNEMPTPLTAKERSDWLKTLTGVTLGSDAFFPFRDSIDRAAGSGARTILQPGGSTRDEDVIAACDEYGMVMLFSGVRLFHH